MKTLRGILVATLAVLVGCTSTTPSTAGSQRGPSTIALLNATRDTLKSVRIEADGDSGGSNRLGQVAPVLPHFPYRFGRSHRAPALPSRVRVSWVSSSGQQRSAVVEIGELLEQSTGAEDETLEFVILADGTAYAQLVSTTPP